MDLKLFACGDVVNFKSNKNFICDDLKSIIQTCDLSICNFEAPIIDNNSKPIKKAGPTIHQSKDSIKYLKDTGFKIVSVANNHIYDYGQQALLKTLNEISLNKLEYIGAGANYNEAYTPKIITKKNIRIGFLAACENEFGCMFEENNSGGYGWLFSPIFEKQIIEIKKSVDFVIVNAHAGVESIDFPLIEWRDHYKKLCDLGADVIIGHHPHIPQGYEKYNDSIIFYSLGNFYFDASEFENSTDDSFSVILNLNKEKKLDFECIYHKKINGQTRLVEKAQVNFNLDELCRYFENQSLYKELNNSLSIKLFEDYYEDYYRVALGRNPKRYNFFKKMIKNIFFKKKLNGILLLHNIRIESHRFLVQRALRYLYERN